MPLLGFKLTDITLSDIESLIATQELEGPYLEYKKTLPDFNNLRDKLEFLYDVSAFANASGGDLIYGIDEKAISDDPSSIIPTAIVGFAIPQQDKAQLQIENIITSNLQPVLRGIDFQWIKLGNGNVILILRVPRSWVRPHAVPNNWDYRVYIRTASGKKPLSFKEIGDMVISASTAIDKIKEFRSHRTELLIQGQLGIYTHPTAVIFHMIPLHSFDYGNRYTAQSLKGASAINKCEPMSFLAGSIQDRFNFDGYFYALYEAGGNYKTQVQYFRNGIIESINNHLFLQTESGLHFSSNDLETGIINAFKQYLDLQKYLGIELPIIATLSLIGVKGALINWDGARFGQHPDPIDRDNLILPELIVEDYEVDPATFLRPAFDSIWNAADLPRSYNYDEKGNRIKR
jgi:hypothetical protein